MIYFIQAGDNGSLITTALLWQIGNLAEAAGSTPMNPQFVNVLGGWVN